MKRKIKSVGFNERANEVFTIDALDGSHWNTFEDLSDMKQASIQQALAIRQEHAHSLMFLDESDTAGNNATYSNTLLEVYVQCRTNTVLSPNSRHRLAVWHANAPTRRGLEFQSVQTVRVERYKQRLRARQAILVLQGDLTRSAVSRKTAVVRKKGSRMMPPPPTITTTVVPEPQDPVEALREASEAISAPSKAFARALAEADEAALDESLTVVDDEDDFRQNQEQIECDDYQGLAMLLLKAKGLIASPSPTTTLPISSYPAAAQS